MVVESLLEIILLLNLDLKSGNYNAGNDKNKITENRI